MEEKEREKKTSKAPCTPIKSLLVMKVIKKKNSPVKS